MKNKLIDVHNILMATLEDLDNEEILDDKENLENILKIAKAKTCVANAIIQADRLSLDAMIFAENNNLDQSKILSLEEAK